VKLPDGVRRQDRVDEHAGVTTWRGVDPGSGRHLLIYESTRPLPEEAQRFSSPHTPRVLHRNPSGEAGVQVVAVPADWERWSRKHGRLGSNQLLQAAATLRDAANAGLVHGDLRPHRFLVSRGRLLIEGYGIGWPARGDYAAPELQGEGSEAGDVWSLAASILEIGLDSEDPTVQALLEQCLSADPDERPTAEELYLALSSLVQDEAAPEEAVTPAAAAPPVRSSTEARGRAGGEWSDSSAWNEREESTPSVEYWKSDGSQGFDPYPDQDAAVLEAQAEYEEQARRRRVTLLAALGVAVVALVLLLLLLPGRGGGGGPTVGAPAEATVYVVDIQVSPGNLPPVTLHLVEAPDGSSLAGRENLGTAPRQVALDRAGTWSFQGSVGQRRSEIVQIDVPEQRTLTLAIPPEAQ